MATQLEYGWNDCLLVAVLTFASVFIRICLESFYNSFEVNVWSTKLSPHYKNFDNLPKKTGFAWGFSSIF